MREYKGQLSVWVQQPAVNQTARKRDNANPTNNNGTGSVRLCGSVWAWVTSVGTGTNVGQTQRVGNNGNQIISNP